MTNKKEYIDKNTVESLRKLNREHPGIAPMIMENAGIDVDYTEKDNDLAYQKGEQFN